MITCFIRFIKFYKKCLNNAVKWVLGIIPFKIIKNIKLIKFRVFFDFRRHYFELFELKNAKNSDFREFAKNQSIWTFLQLFIKFLS